jgi:aminopeptidase C
MLTIFKKDDKNNHFFNPLISSHKKTLEKRSVGFLLTRVIYVRKTG